MVTMYIGNITLTQCVRYNPNTDPVQTTNQPTTHDGTRFSLSTATWGVSTARRDRLDHNDFGYHVNNSNRPILSVVIRSNIDVCCRT